MARCRSCGTEVSESSRVCANCGGTVGTDALNTETVAASTPRLSSKSADSGTSSARHASAPGRRFLPGILLAERYRIMARLGSGGMGEVYRAEDLALGQEVALKFLPEKLTGNEEALARFRSEVRIARQVSHPNVCRVYDVSQVEGHFFLTMEYVDGEDLASLLGRIGRLPADKALEIARKLCAGLAAAHEKGVLHRDLKPGNLMLDGRGQVLLTDFGLAGLADQIAATEVGSGTPAYMAPEQLAGKEVTVRSDIYALGLVLYEIFTGKRPFEGNTLAELMRARRETTPDSPSALIRDLDPAVERVILRCLEPDPSRRPASALAVAAALPGGDPLAAALAAGETPSPQMVAAAGERTGLAPRAAISLFAAVILGMIVFFVLAKRSSALEQIQPPFSPEVLSHKAKDIILRLGYATAAADSASGFSWESEFIRHVEENDKPFPRWSEVLLHRPSPLRFWYRQSRRPLITTDLIDDLMTPGIVTPDQPSPIESGMIDVTLDYQGRLIGFQAIPPQLEEPAKPVVPIDWNPLLAAAGLDPAQLQPAEPLWTFLAASDTRMAWTGTWPASGRTLRVEATAWRGRPVACALIGPWTKPDRMPPESSGREELSNIIIATAVFLGGALLAWRNYARGKGDRRGALRLASWLFCSQLSLWLFRGHFVAAVGTLGLAVLAVSTSLFWAATIWMLYLAVEPYVRRHWPQTIISWSRVLAGHLRDPIVGRDLLFGAALGVSWTLIYQIRYLTMQAFGGSPQLPSTDFLEGARSTLGVWLAQVPRGIQFTLVFFLVLFLLRVLLRNQWLAGAAFVLIFAVPRLLGSNYPLVDLPAQLLIFGIAAVVVLRFGLLALASGIVIANLLLSAPVTGNASAWYFASAVFVLLSVVALATWAFQASVAGQKLWKQDLFA